MNIKKIIDIGRVIRPGMTIWPGDEEVRPTWLARLDKGDECNLGAVSMGLHTGTHVDAPLHFVRDGRDVSALDLRSFLGPAKVFDMQCKSVLTGEAVAGLPLCPGDIVLFKTTNSMINDAEGFVKNFTALDEAAARVLVERKVRTVGVDYLSVEGYEPQGHQVHRILLENGVGIIEGLNLREAEPKEYLLCCLPLCIEGMEAAPARAVLVDCI